MKKILLCTLTLFISAISFSQNLEWIKDIGNGIDNSSGHSVAVDNSENVYTVGAFKGTVDFNPDTGSYFLTSSSISNGYIQKISSDGNFIWAKQISGLLSNYTSHIESISIDDSTNIYVSGTFSGSADFDPSGTSFILHAKGIDAFLLKLDSLGNFIWAKSFGGTNQSLFNPSITTDINQNIYLTGFYTGTVDFDPNTSIFNLTSNGSTDCFVLKLNNNGNLIWAKGVGGTNGDDVYSIKVDSVGNIYLIGSFKNTVDFDPNGTTSFITSNGGSDIFIQKLDSLGNLIWIKSFGGSGNDNGFSLALDQFNNIYTTGSYTNTVDFDPNINTTFITSNGDKDIFVLKLDTGGNFIWAKNIGGSGSDGGISITIDPLNNINITGYFSGITDFDPSSDSLLLFSNGDQDVFIQKLNHSGDLLWAKSFGGEYKEVNKYSVTSKSNNLYLTGTFKGSVDFDPNKDSVLITSSPSISKVFTQKIGSKSYTTIYDSICVGDSILFNLSYIKKRGIYYDTLLNVAGSDSIIELKLSNSLTNSYSDYICKGDSLLFSGNYIKTEGVYFDTINMAGCDSVIKLKLIEVNYYDTILASSCDSLISPSGNYIYNLTGIYNDTLSSVLGCDSIIVIDLTIESFYNTISNSLCFGDSILFGSSYIKTQGVYYDTVILTGGCDSITELILSVNPIYDTTLYSTICGGDSVLFGGSYIKAQGVYYDSLTSILGCDSVIELNLNISIDTTLFFDSTSLSTYQSAGGYFYSTSGIYYESYLNQYSCDSIVKLDLLFFQDTLCKGTIKMDSIGTNYYRLLFLDTNITNLDTVRWEISYGSSTNFYYGDSVLVNFVDSGTHTINMIYIEDVVGGSPYCTTTDSIYMPTTFVRQTLPIIATIIDTGCNYIVSPLGNYYFTTGVYYDTVLTLDSVYQLDYLVKPMTQNFIHDTVCGNYMSANGTIYSTSGDYEELYETPTNCYWDSLWLVITPGTGGAYFYFAQNTPNTILLVDSSYGTNLSYKWSWGDGTYDSAVTTPTHTYSNTGLYEVCLELTDTINGCKYYYCDSLDIDSNGLMRSSFSLNVVRVESVGVNKVLIENSVSLYPNPAKNELWIESANEMEGYEILSVSGQLIERANLTGNKSQINISNIANGYYLIGIKTNRGVVYKKIAISK